MEPSQPSLWRWSNSPRSRFPVNSHVKCVLKTPLVEINFQLTRQACQNKVYHHHHHHHHRLHERTAEARSHYREREMSPGKTGNFPCKHTQKDWPS